MNAKQASRKLRSLYFRKKLLAEFPELEMQLKELVEETGIKFLGGFKIEIAEGHIQLAKVELNSKQLTFTFVEEENIHDEVCELVDAYVEHNQGIEVVGSEIPFEFNINSYQITGTVDLIYKDRNGLIVLRDIKTDSAEPSSNILARDIQFSIYFLGALRGLGIKPDLLEWYQVRNAVPYKRKTTKNGVKFHPGDARGNPIIPVSRKIEDVPIIEREIRYIIQGIRFNIFPMRPFKLGYFSSCSDCDVRKFCEPHGEVVKQGAEFSDLQGFAQYF